VIEKQAAKRAALKGARWSAGERPRPGAEAWGNRFPKGSRGSLVMDRKIKLLHCAKRDDVQHKMVNVKDIRTHPTFANLLRIDPAMRDRDNPKHARARLFPLTSYYHGYVAGAGRACGHRRTHSSKRALEAGIEMVPVVIVAFEDVMAALQRAVSLQVQQRFSTNGAYYRMCETYDTLMERGRKAKEAKELTTRGVHFVGHSASAKKTAQLIGCSYRTVDRIRKIRRDGWPEIQEAVANDEMSINKAYKQIRDMELGNEENGKRSAAAHIKTLKTLLSEENFASLQQLGGVVGDRLNKAWEVYMRWVQGQEDEAVPELEPRTGQHVDTDRVQ
jgi:hypothetical protein